MAPPEPPARLEVGRIHKPHGLKGDLIVSLLTNHEERLDPGTQLWADDQPLEVVRSQPHQHRYIVTFAGLSHRDQADALRQRVLYAEPLDDPDEVWVHELIGSEVRDAAGISHGIVQVVEANPASDLLVLESGVMVPLNFVVDRSQAGVLVVDGPPGLLDPPS
jgi:16S rRNA processing protein RimM